MAKTGRADAVRVLPLAECAEVLPGFSVLGRVEHDPKGTHQLVITKHLTEGVPYTYRSADSLRINPGRATEKYEVRAEDVLFMSRGNRNLAWAISEVPGATIAPVSFYVLRPKAGVLAPYLAWYLDQQPAQAAIDKMRTGAGTPIVQRKVFKQLQVVVPPLVVQRQIADLADLLAQEKTLGQRLTEAAERARVAIGRQIITNLCAKAGVGEKDA